MLKRLGVLFLILTLALPCIAGYADDDEEVIIMRPGQEYDGVDLNGDQSETETLVSQQGLISYPDTNELSVVGILGALGIMGDYDGTGMFKPNVYISRPEFLEGLLKLFKIDYDSENSSMVGQFYDVPKDHEYYGLVYTAVRLGIVSGFENNTFGVNDTISFEDAMVMVLRALGYASLAEELGGYPTGFKSVAARLGMLNANSVNNQQAITRIDMARILADVLETPMARLEYINDETIVTASDGDAPLLHIYHAVKDRGLVETNRFASIDGKTTPAEGQLSIDGKMYPCTDSFNAFLGYDVNFWYDTDTKELIYMAATERTTETIVAAEDFVSFHDGILTHYNNADRQVTVNLSGATLLYNGTVPELAYNEDIFKIKDGSIRYVRTDSGYTVVDIEEYTNYIIRAASFDESELTVRLQYDTTMFTIDASDIYVDVYNAETGADSIYKTTESGEETFDASAFKSGAVLSVYMPYGQTVYNVADYAEKYNVVYAKMVVSQRTVSGTVTARYPNEGKIELDSNVYYIANTNYFGDGLYRLNDTQEGTFLLDAGDKLTALSGSESESDFVYGYLVSAAFSTGLTKGELMAVRLFTEDGEITEFQCADNLKINGEKAKDNAETLLRQSAKYANPDFDLSQVVRYKTKDNMITELQVLTASTGVSTGFEEETHLDIAGSSDNFFIGSEFQYRVLEQENGQWVGRYLNPDVYFVVPSQETTDESYYSSQKPTWQSGIKAQVYDVEQQRPGLMVQYVESAAASEIMDGDYVIATAMFVQSYKQLNDDGFSSTYIDVISGKSARTFECEDSSICEGLEKGQLIRLYGKVNLVTEIQLVYFDAAGTIPATVGNLPEELSTTYNGFAGLNTELNFYAGVYELSGSPDFSVMYGNKLADGSYDMRATGRISNIAWQYHGTIVYEGPQDDPSKATIRVGTYDDLRPYVEYGEKFSRLLIQTHEGAGRCYIIYNFD